MNNQKINQKILDILRKYTLNGLPVLYLRFFDKIVFEKKVIDTSKYKGYSYKLETRSNVTNQYHIKSLLTNEQTGHQLLLANTKVQTPNILTKVIIDQ